MKISVLDDLDGVSHLETIEAGIPYLFGPVTVNGEAYALTPLGQLSVWRLFGRDKILMEGSRWGDHPSGDFIPINRDGMSQLIPGCEYHSIDKGMAYIGTVLISLVILLMPNLFVLLFFVTDDEALATILYVWLLCQS